MATCNKEKTSNNVTVAAPGGGGGGMEGLVPTFSLQSVSKSSEKIRREVAAILLLLLIDCYGLIVTGRF